MTYATHDNAAIFRRHLDLEPLRGRSRGLVRCLFHEGDRNGSLSVDLDKGVFHCFACDAKGGYVRFAELVGEMNPWRRPSPPESSRQQARRWIADQARREGDRAREWQPWMLTAEFVRRSSRAVDQARASATRLGPDHPRTWPLLDLVAEAEREALDVEAELDGILASGRVA